MVVKKESKDKDWEKLISSIQAKVDKIRKAGKRKELQSVDIICSEKDITKTKKR